MNYWNSSFKIKPGAKGLQPSQKPMARTQMKRVPGTARLERSPLNRSRKPMKPHREPPALIKVKRQVRERDNYTCQFPECDKQYKSIDVHHIAKISQRPDLKFDPENMVCLCRAHHARTDTHRAEAVRLGLISEATYELAKKQDAA